METLRDETALFAVGGHRSAGELALRGLTASSSRWDGHPIDEGGLSLSDGFVLRPVGLSEVAVGRMVSRTAIGSSGRPPAVGRFKGGAAAVALAGRITNGNRLRQDLFDRGAVLATGSDAELLLHLCAASGQRTLVNRLVDALFRVEGAFAVVFQTEELIGAVRDPRGLRPLVFGRLDGSAVFASEERAILGSGGEVVREVEPGEMILVDATGARSVAPFPRRPRSTCVQELVAVASPESAVSGASTWVVRDALGARLAAESPVPGLDAVVGLPGSPAYAQGFARVASVPAVDGLRPSGTGWLPIAGAVADRVIALVLPSLTTGLDARAAVAALRAGGASRVHVRLATPPIRATCAYGVSGPTQDELPADASPEGLAALLGADDLGWLPIEPPAAPKLRPGFCDACVTRQWPVAPEETDDQLPLFQAGG